MTTPVPDPALLALLDRVGLDRAGVERVFGELSERMRDEVAAVVSEASAAGAVPEIDFDDVRAGRVTEAARDAVRRRGCVVLRGTFPRSLAEAWDAEIAEYLDGNEFDERFSERYPDAEPGSRIWGVYWSPAQVAARQHESMERARRFLNSFWRHESFGERWFDPDSDIGYPDRLRRRSPGSRSPGLPPHSDAVSSGGWRLAENALVFRRVLAGDPAAYDPWDAAHRTTLDVESTAPASVFRSFQGWTALSEMHPADGVLHLIPIPDAAAYMLMRGIAGELGLLGDPVAAPRRFRADDLLLEAMVPIPSVRPGDTVWWHGDVIHSVAPAANDDRWGNVMYIGAAPACQRNDAYRASMFDRFASGRSPLDFPDEDFEVDFAGRPGVEALTEIGRGQFGLDGARAS